jgi:hypothetical protein
MGKQICDLYNLKLGKALKFIIVVVCQLIEDRNLSVKLHSQILHSDATYEDVNNFLIEKKDELNCDLEGRSGCPRRR